MNLNITDTSHRCGKVVRLCQKCKNAKNDYVNALQKRRQAFSITKQMERGRTTGPQSWIRKSNQDDGGKKQFQWIEPYTIQKDPAVATHRLFSESAIASMCSAPTRENASFERLHRPRKKKRGNHRHYLRSAKHKIRACARHNGRSNISDLTRTAVAAMRLVITGSSQNALAELKQARR